MANVTNIRSIANNLFNSISFVDGENNEIIFTVGSEGGWNGNIYVPWVGNEDEMYKCVRIYGLPENEVTYLFQDYYNPPYEDAVKYCNDGNYSSGQEVKGTKQGGGDRVLIIDIDGNLSLAS
jgi:hypothetical protein